MAKILVLSDSHGNKFGLQAVLEAGRACEAILCLGDIVGYGAHPNECCEILREKNAICLLGNHDAAATGQLSDDWFNPTAQFAARWTWKNLTSENFEWLQSLSPQADFEEWDFEAVHASLAAPLEEYILDENIAAKSVIRMKRPTLFCGHTHQAMVCTANADRHAWRNGMQLRWTDVPNGGEIELEPDEELSILNPGSCGQPRDGNPLAKALIFDSETLEAEFLAVEYDVQSARKAIIDAGLPIELGDRLLRGR